MTDAWLHTVRMIEQATTPLPAPAPLPPPPPRVRRPRQPKAPPLTVGELMAQRRQWLAEHPDGANE